MLYRLPGGRIARIGPAGSQPTAEREVKVARWLAAKGLRVVHALDHVPQPTMAGDRPVTWWTLIPDHRPATTAELGTVLRVLHGLTPPAHLDLPRHDPFHQVRERIERATALDSEDHAWLLRYLEELQRQYGELARPESTVIHGDAWQDNLVVPATGTPILIDLEKVSLGSPDWDLLPIAVDHADFARLDRADYHAFIEAYGGHDVLTTPNFRLLANIRELRWVSFSLSKARHNDVARSETAHRLACLRGLVPRPWTWTAL